MSAAEKLVIVENSGSLAGQIDRSLLRRLELAAEGQAGCSYAFQSYEGVERPVAVRFHVAGASGLGELESEPAYEESLTAGGGGTYLTEVLGMALAEHKKTHGRLPSTLVFWSDFMDQMPSKRVFDIAAGVAEGEALDLKKTNMIFIEVSDDLSHQQASSWAEALEKEIEARCVSLPQEALAALAEARALSEETGRGAPLAKRPGI